MTDSPETFNRWYDSRPKISKASRLLFIFPYEIQSIISEATLYLASRELKEDERMRSIRSLGSEKILGLHKSKNRRREYDENPLLHQAMNYLYVLSEEKREFMAEHILKMIQYIQHYLETCNLIGAEPQMTEVAMITKTYINSGEEAAELFLKKLRYEFLQKMRNGKPPSMDNDSITEFLNNIAQQDGASMKISKAD